ncbi:arginine--tRNA ligase [Devosia sp. J2-20]|uniref:Arginine--tRNA ligase n=1 Tax=Devosia litorisediminis TaxID=2829817 RepID=A0A942I5Z3_9HYPH|nr:MULTISPECIES: arginine--tRNA ligase [Devosia]MBS3848677.1 arginine--tRNA ligase [Devosia litorisediminis]WDQ98277.1 arginine--tRNA ligase [Devosia sp. J2-20]|tara:strand:+ start:2301 stop:4046 length:1746 start_codon:yes stop_codon:yes gene_type:complete
MDVFALFSARVANAMHVLYPEIGADLLARIVVEPPRDAAHGDLSTNAAMVVAKPLGKNPREVATALVDHFRHDSDVTSVEVAGPGFINFRLDAPVWHQVLRAISQQGADYGRSTLGGGAAVNIEYVSANPTGPMHVGHTRGAVFGDTLSSLMAYSGYEVTREYYINDAGSQIDTLARSTMLRYREALGETIEIPPGLYPGDYLVPVGEALKVEFGDSLLAKPEAEALAIVRERVLVAMLELIKADLALLGIHHDVFFSERQLHGQGGDIDLTLQWLREKDMIYQGRLEAPKGKTPEEWEDREQTLFRATDFGDDTDRALIKSDGSYTYFAADIAYHRNKFLRGFNHMINVLGADHSGYVKRLQAATKAVSLNAADMDVRICQLVRLLKNGEPFKMSKRSGDLVTLADVVEEVGADATRFMLMYRRNDASMDFDFALVKEQTKDNPVFYVQYAHARAYSIFKTATRDLPALDTSPAALAAAEIERIVTPEELDLVRVLAAWPRTVTAAAIAHEPHRIAFYVHELAAAFHGFWAKGKDDPQLRFVNSDDPKLTLARLALVDAVRQVIVNALGILGVSAPTELS